MKTYSRKADGAMKLSENFSVKEFACKDGSDRILIDTGLVNLLQNIRGHFGQPVTINSAYRTETYNKAVGGSRTSQHLYGKAADIAVKNISPMEICQYAEYLMPASGGVGLYQTFTHVDVRAARSRWDQRGGAQIPVGGFPGHQPGQPEAGEGGQTPPPVDTVTVEVYRRNGELAVVKRGCPNIGGAAHVPFWEFFEALGYTVAFDGKKATASEAGG